MKGLCLPLNQRGATLIEAMIAIAILTIGILTVMVMQVSAINHSSSAMNRSEANGVAMALLETLKELPFDDANLDEAPPTLPANTPTVTVAELEAVTTRAQLQALIDGGKVHTFTAAGLPAMQPFVQVPAAAAAGTVVDRAGISYQLAWAVQDHVIAGGVTLDKTIWLFMHWNSPAGQNRLRMTTLKYSNVSL